MNGVEPRATGGPRTVAEATPPAAGAVSGSAPTRRVRRYAHQPTVHAEVAPPKHVAPPVQLLPGREVLIGRHKDCDLRIPHASLEPRHARLVWPPALAAPQVIDCGSQRGTRVAGQPGLLTAGEPFPLAGRTTLYVGPVPIQVEIRGEEESWWNETGVEASFDAGPELKGRLEAHTDLVRVLRELERERRTGTLRVGDEGLLVFCLGTIMRAQYGGLPELEAARAIARGEPLAAGPVRYAFTRVFELSEDPPLDLWPSEVLRGGSRRLRQAVERMAIAADELGDNTVRLMRALARPLRGDSASAPDRQPSLNAAAPAGRP